MCKIFTPRSDFIAYPTVPSSFPVSVSALELYSRRVSISIILGLNLHMSSLHKCDIADLILAASKDLGSCSTNAWLGQPLTHLIYKPAEEVVPGC